MSSISQPTLLLKTCQQLTRAIVEELVEAVPLPEAMLLDLGSAGEYIYSFIYYMMWILIEIDEECARDLERVAPAKTRTRAAFIRRAIQRAIDVALDRATEAAYRERPVAAEITAAELVGWDDHNELVRPAHRKPNPKRAA